MTISELLRILRTPKPVFSNRELLYKYAVSSLGTDASPADLAPDELGCAESTTDIIHFVDPGIRWTNPLATSAVYKDMMHGRHFKQVMEPLPGDVIIDPTKFNIVGHCGIVGKNRIVMSNNSFKDSSGIRGIFDENYTLDSWQRYFVQKKGLTTYFFRML